MTANTDNGDKSGWGRWRIVAWSVAGLVFLLPLVAMQFTDDVKWAVGDFIFAGVLILGVGVLFELAVRKREDTSYRAAAAVSLVAAFLLMWLSAGVGIIGADGDPANLMYLVVLGVGVVGALVARIQPRGMARSMLATALAQGLVAVIAIIARLGYAYSTPLQIVVLNGIFVGLFIASARLFWRAMPKAGAA